jgi:hypothetical protein
MLIRAKYILLATTASLGITVLLLVGRVLHTLAAEPASQTTDLPSDFDAAVRTNATEMMAQGKEVFRYDTFGTEGFWGDTLGLHQAIEGAKLGGVGPGVSPKTALAVGLKVDADALPSDLVRQLKAGKVDLDSPSTTLALLKLNAVVGVTGRFQNDGSLRSIGIQCAFCHSTVNDSLAPGIGRRLDGWPNRDLNVGAIIALAPKLNYFTDLLGVDDATVRKVLNSWGPGKYDAELDQDGKAFRRAKAGFDNLRSSPDLITSKLAALHFYQLAIPAPKAPEGSFDKQAATRGQRIFQEKAQCATCHVPPLFVEPGWPMHTAAEMGIDDFQANRSPDKRYRTAPLKGLWAHQKGGFFHDGRFATLRDVVEHYDTVFKRGLTEQEKVDLVEYLKSL